MLQIKKYHDENKNLADDKKLKNKIFITYNEDLYLQFKQKVGSLSNLMWELHLEDIK
jgi:hypothetical protein